MNEAIGSEIQNQFARAVRNVITVERDNEAIAAVRAALLSGQ